MAEENKTKKTVKLSLDQILNQLKIVGRNRITLSNKYVGQSKTEADWKKEFKNRGIGF